MEEVFYEVGKLFNRTDFFLGDFEDRLEVIFIDIFGDDTCLDEEGFNDPGKTADF